MTTEQPDTLELVRLAQANDRQALETLFERYYAKVRQIVALELGCRARDLEQHDDLVQESLVDAFQSLGDFQARSSGELQYWLSRLVLNNYRDLLRRGAAVKRDSGRVHRFASSVLSDSWLAGRETSPSQDASRLELERRLEDALLVLPPRERALYEMRAVCGMEYVEIARCMGFARASSARKIFSTVVAKLSSVLGA